MPLVVRTWTPRDSTSPFRKLVVFVVFMVMSPHSAATTPTSTFMAAASAAAAAVAAAIGINDDIWLRDATCALGSFATDINYWYSKVG